MRHQWIPKSTKDHSPKSDGQVTQELGDSCNTPKLAHCHDTNSGLFESPISLGKFLI